MHSSENTDSKNGFDDNSTQSHQGLGRNSPPHKGALGGARFTGQSSHLPVPKRRSTNSALFRALEQPYDNSHFLSNAPANSFSGSETSNDGETVRSAIVSFIDITSYQKKVIPSTS